LHYAFCMCKTGYKTIPSTFLYISLCSMLITGTAGKLFAEPTTSGPTRTLRQIVASKYPDGNVYVGMAAHGEHLRNNPALPQLLVREFSYVTPANDLKQSYINPKPNQFKWDLPDWWFQQAHQNKLVLRSHSPIGPQSSPWVLEDSRTAEELRSIMASYSQAMISRLNAEATVLWADVVNETWHEGQWFGPKSGTDAWENPWPILGMEQGADGEQYPVYVREAFQFWQNASPRIKLVLNQHELSADSVRALKRLILHLSKSGLRVDAFGWQAHLDSGWELGAGNLALLHDMISWCHSQKLEFHITEFQSFRIGKEEKQAIVRKKIPAPSAADLELRLQAQANTIAAIVQALLEHRNQGVVAINFWHLTDSESQSKDGNMFNDDLTPRPAYFRIKALLENPPATLTR